MTSYKFLSLTLSILLISACSTESQKKHDNIPGARTDFETDNKTNFRIKTRGFGAQSSSTEEFNSYGIPKKKVYNFQACLLERMGGGKITADMPFAIEGSNGFRIVVISDSEGCLNWYETFEYNHIQQEVYIRLKRKITALKAYSGYVIAETAFSPWVNGFYSTNEIRNFYFKSYEVDGNSLATGRIKILGQAPQSIDFTVDTLNFEFKGLDYKNYSLDRFLNLTIAHKYTLRIKPSVLRKTVDNAALPQALVGGKFKAYLAVFRDEENSEGYKVEDLLAAQEFDLNYAKSTGQYMNDISLKFKNVSEMTSRTKALLTLVPSEDLEGLTELNYEGSLKPAPFTALTLSPGTTSAKVFFDQQKKIATTNLKPFDVLKADTNFSIITTENPVDFLGMTWYGRFNFQEVLNKALYGPALTAAEKNYLNEALCQKLYPLSTRDGYASSCQRNPGFYIKTAVRYLVDEVTSKPEPLNETSVEDLEMKFSYAAADKFSYSRGWKASVGGGIGASLNWDILSTPKTLAESHGLKGALSLKGSGGLDYNWVWEGKYTEDKSTTVTSTTSTKITSEGNTFGFNVNAVPCLFAVPGDGIAKYLSKNNIKKNGVYLCGSQKVAQKRQETWYLLTQNLGVKDSPFSDSIAKRAGPWRTMVRGKVPMMMFYHFLKDAKTTLVLERLPSAELKTEFDAGLMQMQEFPGMLPL